MSNTFAKLPKNNSYWKDILNKLSINIIDKTSRMLHKPWSINDLFNLPNSRFTLFHSNFCKILSISQKSIFMNLSIISFDFGGMTIFYYISSLKSHGIPSNNLWCNECKTIFLNSNFNLDFCTIFGFWKSLPLTTVLNNTS